MGMHMNIPTTQIMQLVRAQSPDHLLQISEHDIQQIFKFKYLGSIQSSDLLTRAYVSNRLASAANAALAAWLKLSRLHIWDDGHIRRDAMHIV